MDDVRFGGALRAARLSRGWSQAELARRAKVGRTVIVRIEHGRLEEVSLSALRRVAAALEIAVEHVPRSRGAYLERVSSGRHAALAEGALRWIDAVPGWLVRPEVSFNIWGDRGVVDLLAWHAESRSVLVIELKTAIVDVGELLGTLDRKVRLGLAIAESAGWEGSSVSACLVVGDGSTNRRRLAEHARTFRAALPDDGRRLRAWMHHPSGSVRALIFLSDDRPRSIRSGFATLSRVPSRRHDVLPVRAAAERR